MLVEIAGFSSLFVIVRVVCLFVRQRAITKMIFRVRSGSTIVFGTPPHCHCLWFPAARPFSPRAGHAFPLEPCPPCPISSHLGRKRRAKETKHWRGRGQLLVPRSPRPRRARPTRARKASTRTSRKASTCTSGEASWLLAHPRLDIGRMFFS